MGNLFHRSEQEEEERDRSFRLNEDNTELGNN